MGSPAVIIDPATGERSTPRINPETGERYDSPSRALSPPPQVTPDVAADIFKAGVHSKMLGVTPGVAYESREEIEKQLRERGGNYDDGQLDPTIANDIKVGLEGSIFGLYKRGQMPDRVRNPGLIDRFISGLSEMVADLPFYAAGGAAGGAVGGMAGSEVPVVGNITLGGIGAGAGSFALPAALREALVQGIQKGDVKDFPDLLRRAASVTWEGTKGALTGAVMELSGGIAPVIAKSPLASMAVKGLFQATTLTTAADLLEGHLPTAQDFAGNAALIVPLNLVTHGLAMKHGEAKQALMDVYARDGKTPQESAETLAAQPPVKPDMPEGLRPAIQMTEGFVDGDTAENHADLAERVLAKKPVTMEELEAEPAKADDVLQNPHIQDQEVIDRAWQLKKEAIEAGDVPRGTEAEDKPLSINDLYDRAAMKSGRGFVTPDGKFLSRSEARKWMKDNEPDVHEMWLQEAEGDKQAELRSEAYASARNRAQARSVAEGEPVIASGSSEEARRLAASREGLNKIKAGDASKSYGQEVLRTLFAGQRDTRIAATTQLRDSLEKLIPEHQDQEALSILRDYKGSPDKLAADLEEIRNGDNERLKGLIPSIERAMNPSSELLEADRQLTDYYTAALSEARQFKMFDSSIDPANYSPHLMTRILEGEQPSSGTSRPAMTQSTPFGKERKYPTILDALKTEKLDARTLNALDSLSIYGDRHATVVATKIVVRELRNTELGKYGTQNKHPEGWVELAPGQQTFRNTRAITDPETGDPFVMSQSLYVPKDVADAMKPLFEQGLKGTPLAPLLKAQGYVKALELGLSLFHVKALNVTAFNNMGLADFMKAVATDLRSPEFAEAERSWAADGLTTAKTSTPYEAYQGLKKSSVPTGFDKLADVQVVKQADSAFRAITEYTFEVVQRKFKVQDAALKEASWLAKHPEATNEEHFAARRSIAKEVNSAYGGLNWDVLGVGKTMRDVSRLFLLAPDWCVDSQTRAMTKTGWKYHHELQVGDEIMAFDPDTKTLKWSPMKDRYVNTSYSGKMVQVKNYNRSILMTPDHKCYVRNFTKRKDEIVLAKNLQTNHLIPRCAEYPAPEVKTYDDMLVVLVGWIVTDGYVKRSQPGGAGTPVYRYGKIVQSKPYTVAMLKALGLKWTVDSSSGNHDKFFANFPRHVFNIPKRFFCQMEDEGVSDGLNWSFLSKLTSDQRALLYDTMMLGDGTGQNRFCGKEREVFFMTMLQTLMGKPTTFIHEQPNCWRTRILADSEISCWGHSDNRTEIDYEGTIWCPSVDTGFWLAERGGLVFITGNTFSNVLTAKYAFEGGAAGSAARMFWAKSFATGFAMTAAASIAIGGKYDPSDTKHMDQVYLGTDKDGKEMYANWFFAGAPKDAMTLVKRAASDSPIAATAEFIVSKASPALGILSGLSANKQGSGAPIYKRTDSTGQQTLDQAKFVAGRVAPITGVSAVKTVADTLTDPTHEYSYGDLLELAADALGSPTIHSGAAATSDSGNSTKRFQSAGRGGKSRFSIRSKR